MYSWHNPLPAETVIGALAGAILGSLLERNDYFDISIWLDSFAVLQLICLILIFGISAHFYCAACSMDKGAIKRWAFYICIGILIGVLFLYPKNLGIGADGEIKFTPHAYNFLMAGVLVVWLLTLRLLTLFKTLAPE